MQALGINVDRPYLQGVLSEEIEEVWPLIAGRVRKALENGNSLEEPDSIRGALMDQAMQLWFVKQGELVTAVVVTSIEVYDQGKTLQVVALEGEGLDAWLGEVERTLRVFGAAHGCKYLSMIGRKGWLRTLRRFNWDEKGVIMRKEL